MKISAAFFFKKKNRNYSLNQYLFQKGKDLLESKEFYERKKNKLGGLTFSDFKIYHKDNKRFGNILTHVWLNDIQ